MPSGAGDAGYEADPVRSEYAYKSGEGVGDAPALLVGCAA